jgi:hypothetical protein
MQYTAKVAAHILRNKVQEVYKSPSDGGIEMRLTRSSLLWAHLAKQSNHSMHREGNSHSLPILLPNCKQSQSHAEPPYGEIHECT